MDVFHFWKDFDADLRAGRIGSFKSSAERLKEFNEGSPNYIWAFRTPKGRKGELQLLARLVWNDRASTGAVIGYDPTHRDSVLYQDPDGTAIPAVTNWVSRNFHRMKLVWRGIWLSAWSRSSCRICSGRSPGARGVTPDPERSGRAPDRHAD